jgi:methylmalonyl-CoA epimerase
MTRIDHIGIIVSDLEVAVHKLSTLLGKATIKEMPEVGLRVAELRAANVTIELLQYTAGSEFARAVMGERLGLNHISAHVEDVEQSISQLKAEGFEPKPGFPREGAHGRVAFFEPDAVTGLLFEVCKPHG